MQFVKRSTRKNPKLSLILLDWSVRESFHLLHYLGQQDVPRDTFEVIVIEYYSRVSEAIRKFEGQIDTWVTLDMPGECYYHKHLMYNVGFVLSRGEICVICDSDAMVKPGFVHAIIEAFDRDPDIILHLDEFRNDRREFYPFNYPSFLDVTGQGCINNAGGTTLGVASDDDRIHTRNYGACMCARRDDLIAIGGADEHIDFLGHICGPYDMTFRLINFGRKEVWHQSEFLYHTWHPGQAGEDNYLGPHDGRHMSTTALDALCNGRVKPLVENAAIRYLREQPAEPLESLLNLLVRPDGRDDWSRASKRDVSLQARVDDDDIQVASYSGFLIFKDANGYYAHLALDQHRGRIGRLEYACYVDGTSLEQVKLLIRRAVPRRATFIVQLANRATVVFRAANFLLRKARAMIARMVELLMQTAARLIDTVSRGVSEHAAEGTIVTDVLPNLYYLRNGNKNGAKHSDVTVVVQRRDSELSLRALSAFRIIPQIKVIRADNTERLLEFMNDSRCWNGDQQVLISRKLYLRAYHLVPPGRVGRQIITF